VRIQIKSVAGMSIGDAAIKDVLKIQEQVKMKDKKY
jgi:hypothetical protein